MAKPKNSIDNRCFRSLLLATRLLNHCERFQGHILAAERRTVNDSFFAASVENQGELIQFEVTGETFMTSKKPLSSFRMEAESEQVIPDIFPLKNTVSIPKTYFYEKRNIYRK